MAVWVIRAQDYVLLTDQEPGQPEWEPGGLDPGRGLRNLQVTPVEWR